MSKLSRTGIPYLTHVWSPVVGCSPAGAGCLNCYSARLAATRLSQRPEYAGLAYRWRGESLKHEYTGREYDWTGEVRFLPERLDAPLHRRKRAVIGVCFMGDLFHEGVTDQAILSVFNTVSMGPPQHTYAVLTKRPERMREFVGRYLGEWRPQFNGVLLPNLILGVSIWDQDSADRMIPVLLDTPAACRIVSYEPAIGAVDFSRWLYEEGFDPEYGPLGPTGPGPWIDGIILGGESGPGARPMQPQWALDIWRQCREAGVPFYFKQVGDYWGKEVGRAWAGDDGIAMMQTKQLPEVMVP